MLQKISPPDTDRLIPAGARQWWQQQSERDQKAVKLLSVFLVLVLFYKSKISLALNILVRTLVWRVTTISDTLVCNSVQVPSLTTLRLWIMSSVSPLGLTSCLLSLPLPL